MLIYGQSRPSSEAEKFPLLGLFVAESYGLERRIGSMRGKGEE